MNVKLLAGYSPKLIENLPIAVGIVNKFGKIMYVNNCFTNWTCYSIKDSETHPKMLSDITGVGLLREIKKLFPDIQPNRIMVSGYAAPGDIEDAFTRYNLFRFILKS